MRQKKKIVYVLIVKQKSHCKALVFLFCFSPLGAYEKVEPCAVNRYVSLGCSCSGIAVLGNLLFSKNKQTKNHHLVLFFFFFLRGVIYLFLFHGFVMLVKTVPRMFSIRSMPVGL